MMSSFRSDLTTRIHPEPPPPPSYTAADHFDYLPDSLLLLIFNNIGDVKSLGRCSVVSKRFQSLIPQVENVVVRVDCVISENDNDSNSSSATCISDNNNSNNKSRSTFSNIVNFVIYGFQAIGQLFTAKRNDEHEHEQYSGTVTHHSPTQVLKCFNEIKHLKIELPSGELGVDDDVLLKWKAEFGSTLDHCVMLGAASVTSSGTFDLDLNNVGNGNGNGNDDNGIIPESFYTNGGLKLRVVWTISSLIAASARHYLLQQIIAEHKTLDSLVLTDLDRQGVLFMNKEQLEELRVKPLSASSASKRTLVPALNMKLWYAPYLELPNGVVLKGATLVAIRPSEQLGKNEVSDGSWVSGAFEEPYGTAARMLVKRRTYCLEMNSF